MNDPGHDSYVAAYGRILDGGVLALFEDTKDGVPLIGSFEVTENPPTLRACPRLPWTLCRACAASYNRPEPTATSACSRWLPRY
jgi:hypothetical protein